MKSSLARTLFCVVMLLLSGITAEAKKPRFVEVHGKDLVTPKGDKLFIVGTNLGNWLNPEGYMFGFSKCNSYGMINQMFCQLVGPDRTAEFWEMFKENYVTAEDIRFIASTGSNTIRLPFHYKLFTNEDYMGENNDEQGFRYIDRVVEWCRSNGLYLILDMHDCPGGQTGDNIDDSYGYPWLFESEASRQKFCNIWQRIAARYKNETVILGYELMNEPIAHYFDMKHLNNFLEPLYKRAVAAIRKVDTNHIVLLGGARWNSDFFMFTDWTFDDKIMYTCHRYGGEPTAEAIHDYTEFRDKSGLPMYMGETGHNTEEWQKSLSKVMRENNIGYTFWPYKKVDKSCFVGFDRPENWQKVIDFAEADRGTYKQIREARPSQEEAWKAMLRFVENSRFANANIQHSYIQTLF